MNVYIEPLHLDFLSGYAVGVLTLTVLRVIWDQWVKPYLERGE